MHTAINEYFRTAPAMACLLPLSEPARSTVLDAIAAQSAGWEDDKTSWPTPRGSTEEWETGLPAAGQARLEAIIAAIRAAAATEHP